MKIISLGNATWDRVYNVSELPSEATKYFSNAYYEFGGGVAATASVAISTLGAKSYFIGRLGNDGIGNQIKQDLENDGVDTTFIKKFDNASSSNAVVHVDQKGERQITVHRDPNLPIDPDWIQESMLDGVSCILCDCTWIEGAEKLIRLANEKDIPSVIDADLGGGAMKNLLKIGSHIAFSYPALCQLTGEDDIESGLRIAQKETQGVVYVTRGENGCYWLENNELVHVPGFNVNVVDTTGAGDVFHGALAFAIGRKLRGYDAVRFANAVAALKCTKIGGRSGVPTFEAVLNFLERN